MTMFGRGSATVAFSVLLLSPRLGIACGASLEPYVSVARTSPQADAEGVPLNHGILVESKAWGGEQGHLQFAEWRVTRAETPEELLLGRDVYWGPGMLLWQPEVKWSPNQTYRVRGTLNPSVEPPDEAADAQTRVDFTFTTGSEVVEPLRAEGKLEVTWEVSTRPVVECVSDCGGACETTGEVPALVAKIALPAIDGGLGDFGYRAWLSYSEYEPAIFEGAGDEGRVPTRSEIDLLSLRTLKASEPHSFEEYLVSEGRVSAPCFAVNVWDVSGQSLVLADCLEPMDPADILAQVQDCGSPDCDTPSPAENGADKTPSDAGGYVQAPPKLIGVDETSEDGGCAIAPGGMRPRDGSYVIALLGMLWFSRRRDEPEPSS